MKKHFLKSFALLAMLFSALTLSAQSGVDWSTYEFLVDGAGGGTYSNKYKISTAEGMSVVNIQIPGFTQEPSIYATFPAGISDCNVSHTIQGAGIALHISAFTAKETQVTINYAGGSCTFWVYYADGTEGGEGGEEPEPEPEEPGEIGAIDWSSVEWVAGSDNKYKVYHECLSNVINVQQPGWAAEKGIYVTTPAGISECTVNGAIDGAGMILYLSSFTAKETEVTITHGLGTCTFWVYYADGTEGGGEGGEEPDPTPTPDPEETIIAYTYFAPNWNVDPTSSATYDANTGTITVDIKNALSSQWQGQVKVKHDVAFSADKQYTLSCKFHATAAVGGVTLKMDDNAEVLYENQSITLPANEDYFYTSAPSNGIAGNNQVLVFDFGWAPVCQITISDIVIQEVAEAVTPPAIVHPEAAPAPTWAAEQVLSIYSDIYTPAVTRTTGKWNQTTKDEEVELATGEKAFYCTNSNYLGWEFDSQDISKYPYIQMNVYVEEAGTIDFTPIWGSQQEKLKTYNLQTGWNTLNINLRPDFEGIDLTKVYQIKWANMPATCYIDNVIFYNPVLESNYCQKLLTSGDKSINLSCEKVSAGNYRVTIEGDNLSNISGGTYLHKNKNNHGEGNFQLVSTITSSTETKIVCEFEAIDPEFYTPLYVMMPGEVNFGTIDNVVWGTCPEPEVSVLTTLTATAASSICKVGETVAITIVAKDQYGITMDAGTVNYAVSPADAGSVVENVYTPSKAGLATITASVGSVQATAIEIFAYEDGANLALSTNINTDNKVIAQSDFAPSGTDAWNAVDGDEGSVWQGSATNGSAGDDAARTYNSWFVVDLGAHYNLNLVTITFEGACSQNYTVAVSSDYINWNTAYTHNGSAGVNGRTDNLFGNNLNNATNVRFVRFWSTKAATHYGMKVYEFKVFGTKVADKVVGTNNPVVQSAVLKSKTPTSATITLSATDADNTGIVKYHVTDAANGLDKILASLTNDILVKGLKDNTTYTLVVAAIDVDGNESAPFTMESFTTAADPTKPTTPAPVPTRDAEDVLSFYSDAYTSVINFGWINAWTNALYTEETIEGDKYLHYSDKQDWGWEFGVKEGYTDGVNTGVDCSAMEFLHVDVWGYEAGTIRVTPIYGGAGLTSNERYYAEIEVEAGKWNSVDVALADFVGTGDKHDFTTIHQFKFSNRSMIVAIDNVYFWKSAGTLPVESVTLDKTAATIEVEEALQLKATVLPMEAANKNVVWTSSNTAVATVSAEGVVTGLTVGTTTITATTEDGNKTATCAITVEPITAKTWWGGPVTLTLAGQEHYVLYSFTRNENKTITYTAIFDQGNIDVVKQVSISDVWNGLQWIDAEKTTASWTSTSTHNAGEKILGFFYFGGPRINFDTEAIAYIVGSSNERPSTAVTSVTLDKTICNLLAGETIQLSATVNPGYADNKAITWTSNAESVATVDANGLVTAKAEGTATITVTTADGGKTATCTINVSPLQARTWWGTGEVTINGHDVDIIYSITHNLDKTLTYTVIFGDDTDMIRQVNARSVADVYHNLTGFDSANKTASYTSTTTHSSGEVITGFFYFGVDGVDFTYTVGSSNERPNPSVEGVALNHTTYDLLVNETLQLNATIYPGYAENKAITWSSNNSAIAEVDANGLVTAKAVGTATITVTTADGNKTATCTVTVIAALTESTYYASTYVKKDADAYLGINYSITRTSNRTLRYVVKVNNSEDVDLELNVVVDDNWQRMEYNASANTYTYTTVTKYADGDVVSGFFRQIKYGTEGRWDFNYVVGSTSTTPRTMVAVNDEDADLTHLNDGSVYDVILKRNFVMDNDWNTISLPFALTEEQVKEVFGEGTRITKLLSSELKSSTEIDIQFEDVTSIEAATPYLILPEKNVDLGTLIENITINVTPNILEAGITKMIPVLKTENFTGQDNTFFLGANDNLYNRSADGKIKGMRAYFQFSTLTPEQLRNVRARVVFNENVETSVDNLITDEAPVKMIQNGHLIIIRNGIKYNIQGQKL